MAARLPPIADLPTLPTTQLDAILDLLFEPSAELRTLSLPLLRAHAFASYDALIAAVGMQLTRLTADDDDAAAARLASILESHPRLGAARVESALSRAEQAQLQAGGGGGAAEEELLRGLNEEYEARFPGLRYVVFVNGRSRAVIADDMRARIAEGDWMKEREGAIRAMCEIAADRARKLAS